jgi:hypothetical protein
MELKTRFAFTPLPPIARPLRFSLAGPTGTDLGLLEGLKGTWTGRGFNVIWRPFQGGPADQDRFLELNLTQETLRFEEIPGAIPNRGLLQPDITMFGLWYLQTIADANIKDTNGKLAGLHLEPGIWATVPQTEHPQEVPTVVRMASIPHGTTVLSGCREYQFRRAKHHGHKHHAVRDWQSRQAYNNLSGTRSFQAL